MNLSDSEYMKRAIELAKLGVYTAKPNPCVGCVIVKANEIVGLGFHRKAGEPHAEINALRDAQQRGIDVEGATAYVTLEPCSHHGKTGPCCEALVTAKLARVVVAMTDPNPLVAGRGCEYLRSAGVEVALGVEGEAAKALNKGFIKRMEQGLPWVQLKMAMSLDGRTAMASGESQWITGPEARAAVQQIRAEHGAIITGVDTVIYDNARLTVRDASFVDEEQRLEILTAQPLRVVLDSALRLPLSADILKQPGETWLLTLVAEESRHKPFQKAGARVIVLPEKSGRIDLQAVLSLLAQAQCNSVLVEAGAALAGSFVAEGFVDQLSIFMAPTLLGSDARPLLNWPLSEMAEQQRLDILSIVAVGDDWRIDAKPVNSANK